jgi:hypothetical protein
LPTFAWILALAGMARAAPAADPTAIASETWAPLPILGAEVVPGEKRQLGLRISESFAGDAEETPVLVIRGVTPGPTVCLAAGVHGDELNGIEIVRSLFEQTSPRDLSGTLIGLPIANLLGLRRSSRYLPDRRDLNRYFPGFPTGSAASRIASALFTEVVSHCEALVDYHTGSFRRTNFAQVRGDLRDAGVLRIAKGFGVGLILHSTGSSGTLRRAAQEAGIDAVTYEAGEPLRFQPAEIERGLQGTRNLLAELDMLDEKVAKRSKMSVYYRSRWVRVDDGGIFLTQRKLGERVAAGDELGTVTDPVTHARSRVVSPLHGRILGMAFPQVVLPGFAAFHLGIEEAVTPESPPADASGRPDQLDPEEHPE